MREIASTFEAAGLPDGFHAAAAAVYERIASTDEGQSLRHSQSSTTAM